MRGTGVHAVLGKNSLLRHRVTTLKCPLRVRERRKRGVITQSCSKKKVFTDKQRHRETLGLLFINYNRHSTINNVPIYIYITLFTRVLAGGLVRTSYHASRTYV